MADNIAVASASFIVLYNLLKKKKKTRKQRRWWSTQLYLTRRRVNNINIFLWNDSLADKESDQFKNFLRMSEEDFIKIFFNSIKEKISKNDTTFRKAVPVEERLAVTLRYLATGDSFTSLQYLFKISKQLISQIVPEVCQAIIDCLISYVKVFRTPSCNDCTPRTAVHTRLTSERAIVVNMADGDLLVTISGAALSLLFYENVRSVGEQMGFLLGEALEFIVKTYTDSDNQVETVKIHINVETIVTCSLTDLLHDSTGRINKESLKDFVRDKSKQVIGWFRFRRNTSSLIPTMRDRVLHKQFASHFSGGNSCREDFFLACLLNASTSETRGTHKFRHVFLRHKRGQFEPIPLRINNLGDDASRHDGSDYKPTPLRNSARAPDGFTELIESLKLDMTRISGLDSAMMIQKAAERHLMSLIPKVCESDLEVSKLERQVRDLKDKLAAQQLSRKTKVNGESYKRTFKASRENCLSEKIDSSTKDEMKIGDDMRLQREHIPSCAQPVTSNSRTPNRNTAACIAKSVVSQEKTRRLGRSNSQEDSNQQHQQDVPFANSRRAIPEIATEPICQEDSEVSVGRGRGSGRGNPEFTPGMKKRRGPGTAQAYSTRERTITPEQDFSDAECSAAVSLSSPVLRSCQVTKKINMDECNTVDI